MGQCKTVTSGWRKRGGGLNMAHGDGGKGSGRRVENSQAVRDGWEMIDDDYEDEQEEHEHDDDEGYPCPVCRGDMAVTGTGMYWFCDTCGHREELEHDY
jgi:hypothetical protein